MPCGCDGGGCDGCDGAGTLTVAECPARWCGADAFLVLDLVELAQRGSWPDAGGTLDQPLRFVQAMKALQPVGGG